MSITVGLEQYVKDKSGSDMATIAIRVTYKGVRKYKETDYAVPVDKWDGKQVMNTYYGSQTINAKLQAEQSKVLLDLLDIKDEPGFGIPAIVKYLSKGKTKKNRSFIRFVYQYIKDQGALQRKEKTTLENYGKEIRKLEKFLMEERKVTDLSFDEIDKNFMEAYEIWLIKKGNVPNTRWGTLTKFFTKMLGAAKVPYPEGYEKPILRDSGRDYLTLDELTQIENCLDELPEDEKIVACYFLVECYSGIRFGDWQNFKIETMITKEKFNVRADKNGEYISLTLEKRPRLKGILNRIKAENLEFAESIDFANRKLKLIARSAKIKKNLSTHIGRFTCATNHAEMGYSLEFIAELLGVSIDTAKIYTRITRQRLRNEEELRGGL